MVSEDASARAQTRAAWVSALATASLLLLKIVVGWSTGSIAVLSEAANSALDLLAAAMTLAAVRVAVRPPDADHPFGHGKAQHLSALFEGLVILVAGLWIAVEAASSLAAGEGPEATGPGIAVMLVSAATAWLVSRHLQAVARRTGAPALAAGAVHLRTDVASSGVVLAALLLVRWTGLAWFDAAAALAVVCFVAVAAYPLLRDAVAALMDSRLSEDEERAVAEAIDLYRHRFVNVHRLRTRRAGIRRYVDFHLVVHRTEPIGEVHDLCDDLEAAVRHRLPGADVVIHAEPCGPECAACSLTRRG